MKGSLTGSIEFRQKISRDTVKNGVPSIIVSNYFFIGLVPARDSKSDLFNMNQKIPYHSVIFAITYLLFIRFV